MTADRPIRVLVVDDSAIVRKILVQTLSAEPDMEVVGSAPDPYIARDKILALEPDVLTLDIEMPRMDGLTFLKKLMHYRPMPVVVISSVGQSFSEAAIEAMHLGAVEVLAKPAGPYSVEELRTTLPRSIRAAAAARIRSEPARVAQPVLREPSVSEQRPADGAEILAIGASTGGTEAIASILRQLPANLPGCVVTQHIPAGFSRAFAEHLNRTSRMEVREAVHGECVIPGRVLIAPGGYHMLVRKVDGTYRVVVKDGPRVCYQRPSVDVLFASVAEAAGPLGVGVILTGMGSDGAEGMLKMKQAGAFNISQDETSSVVFGMPREAIRRGAVDKVLPLSRIPEGILAAFESMAASHR